MPLVRRAALAACLLLSLSPAFGQEPSRQVTDFTVHPVFDLSQSGNGGQVGNAKPAKTADWPASAWGRASYPGGAATCSGSFVSARVFLTAAHCVPPDTHQVFLRGDYQRGKMTCESAREKFSAMPEDADYALCVLDAPYTAVTGPRFETIGTTPVWATAGAPLLVTGWGCTTPDAPPEQPTFRTGTLHVDRAVPGTNQIVTRDEAGMPYLCHGDSGAGAYVVSGPNSSTSSGRRLVAINYTGDETVSKNDPGGPRGASVVVSLATADFRRFVSAWVHDHPGMAICGITSGAPNCHG